MKLTAQKRSGEKAKKLLSQNLIPAVIYGPKVKNEAVSVDRKKFKEVLNKAGETTLFDLEIEGKTFNVLINDIQRDFISSEPIHIDFYSPRLDIELKAKVSLVFDGEAPAVKSLGGILIKSMQEVEVRALPADLPHEFRVDLGGLKNFGDTVYVRDLKLPKNVKWVVGEDTPIVSVVEPEKEVEAVPVTTAEAVPPPTEREIKAAEKAKVETEKETAGKN